MVTNKELRRMYEVFNKKWFSNQLPKDMVVVFEVMEICASTSYYRERPLYIRLNKKLRWSYGEVAMTLLHEMVHVELPYSVNHGPRFHKRMIKLARKGAFFNYW